MAKQKIPKTSDREILEVALPGQQLHDKLQQLLDFRNEKRTRLASLFLDVMIDSSKQKRGAE